MTNYNQNFKIHFGDKTKEFMKKRIYEISAIDIGITFFSR